MDLQLGAGCVGNIRSLFQYTSHDEFDIFNETEKILNYYLLVLLTSTMTHVPRVWTIIFWLGVHAAATI